MSEFKSVKNNIKSENIKDIVKELERAIFGYDNEKPEYQASIAERTKMRRQNKETDKKDGSDGLKRIFAPPDPSSSDLDESTEKVYDEEGYDGTGYDKWGFNKDGFNKDGFNEDGYDMWEFNKDGFNEDGYD